MLRHVFFKLIIAIIVAACSIIAGCGGSVAPTPVSTTPATPITQAPTPPPTPTPTPTPVPTPTPATNPDRFQAAMFDGHTNGLVGSVVVNGSANDGNGSVTLTGAPASTSLDLQFCPFFANPMSPAGAPCYHVVTVQTDAAGNGQMNFRFPKSGVLYGNFKIPSSADPNFISTGYTYTSTPDYHTSIQPAAQARDVNWTSPAGSDSLTSGSLNIHGTMLTIQLTGALPSSTYQIVQCPGELSSGCQQFGNITTDASGTADFNFDLTTEFGSNSLGTEATFHLVRANNVEYVAGFKVQ